MRVYSTNLEPSTESLLLHPASPAWPLPRLDHTSDRQGGLLSQHFSTIKLYKEATTILYWCSDPGECLWILSRLVPSDHIVTYRLCRSYIVNYIFPNLFFINRETLLRKVLTALWTLHNIVSNHRKRLRIRFLNESMALRRFYSLSTW
jgi:hypothetical protein